MKNIILFFLKPLSFLPALIMMYAIYSFSAQSGEESGNLSYTISYKIVEIGNETFDVGIGEEQLSYYARRIEYPVRKLAHMTEYFLLAVAVSFPFYVYGLRGFPLMLVAGLICVGFAAGDEYHQSFVAGRGPSKKDVVIDSIGAFGGIITVRIICWTFLAPFRVAKRIEERAERKEMERRRAEEREIERERERARRRAMARRRKEVLEYEYEYIPEKPKKKRAAQQTAERANPRSSRGYSEYPPSRRRSAQSRQNTHR